MICLAIRIRVFLVSACYREGKHIPMVNHTFINWFYYDAAVDLVIKDCCILLPLILRAWGLFLYLDLHTKQLTFQS